MFTPFVGTCILPHKFILDLKDYVVVGCGTCRFTYRSVYSCCRRCHSLVKEFHMDSCLLEYCQCQPTPHWYFVLFINIFTVCFFNLQLSIMILKVSYPLLV